MSNYGMVFDVEIHDADNGFAETHVISMPGDYDRASTWIEANLEDCGNETVDAIRRNYALVWHVLKRRGKLAELGAPDELTPDTLSAMEDRYTVYLHDFDESKIPLAGAPSK